MIRSIPLANKPLCIFQHDNNLFIGDARGRVLKLNGSLLVPYCLASAPGPVSTVFFTNDKLVFGTWDGILYLHNHKEIKLGTNPIKCGIFYNDKIFVSIDNRVIILNQNLEILEQIETDSKVFCMNIYLDKLYLGLGNGKVFSFIDSLREESQLNHEKAILSIRNEITGSTDCTLRKNGEILFEGVDWIRSILNEDTFSSGKDVYIGKKLAYSHSDEVTGMEKINGSIVSIGLDYCYKIYQEEFKLTEEEEKELLLML